MVIIPHSRELTWSKAGACMLHQVRRLMEQA